MKNIYTTLKSYLVDQWQAFSSHEGLALFVLLSRLAGAIMFLSLADELVKLPISSLWTVAVVVAVIYLPTTYVEINHRREDSYIIKFARAFRSGFEGVNPFLTYLWKHVAKLSTLWERIKEFFDK